MNEYILSLNPALCLLVCLVVWAAWLGAFYAGQDDVGSSPKGWRLVLMILGILVGGFTVVGVAVSIIACIIKAAYA